ncbi:MAG TPA: peptidoglycan DD-metalloendopeptidase family protein [Candidatus Micrarchaeaceae archaeon]|nr:peptidoglycan DD-metalloendopeptidase family protein [Candidatus Micrarchaeaceae archaeon]
MRGLLVALCVALVWLGPTGVAAAPPAPAPAAEKAVIDQIRAELGSNLADAMAAEEQIKQSLIDNTAQQQNLQGQIADAQQRIDDLDKNIAAAELQEAFLGMQIDDERAQLSALARAMYTAPTSILVILGEAQSLSDLLTRISDLNAAGSNAATVKQQLASDLTQQTDDRVQEQADRDVQVMLQNQLASELVQLRKLHQQQVKSMADLQAKIAETQWELAILRSQSAKLAQAVTDMLQQQEDAIIAAAMQSVWTQVQLWTQANNVGTIPTSAGHSTKYRFIWPEPHAVISQGFGPSKLVLEPPYDGYPHFHTGIDLVEPFGSPVYAADDGMVALVGVSSQGYGRYVVIAHSGGLDTLYGHLSASLVKVGQVVAQGQTIGLEGSTGNSTGPHLHFELRIKQQPIDPTPYLPPGAPSPYNA